jgi:hypothetical protein
MQLAALEKSWGLGSEVEERFHLLEEISAGAGPRWFAARERLGGVMRWLACEGPGGGRAELGVLGQKLDGLEHPHLLKPVDFQAAYIAFEWRGEVRLNPRVVSQMTMMERARVAAQLVGAVEYLHGRPTPVPHGAISLSHVWASPSTHWVKLSCMSADAAERGMQAEDISNLFGVVEELITGPGTPPASLEALSKVREESVHESLAPWGGLKALLASMYINLVSADI